MRREIDGIQLANLKVGIVQGYVPAYRVALFSQLAAELGRSNIELTVIAGTPTGSQASRRDAVSHAQWLRRVEPHRIAMGKHVIPVYGTDRHWKECDGVIFTLRTNSVDLDLELLKKSFTRRRVGAWGHIKRYREGETSFKLAIERRKMRRCDHLFSYTRTGARVAIEAGVESENVTAVMNSTSVAEMLAESDSLESAVVQSFEQQHKLKRGKTFGYVGAIDGVKRIDFLADSLDILWRHDPQIKLVMGGRGDQETLLETAINRGQVVRLGYAGPTEKALISRVSEALLHPGPIGLVAVECMALGMPILTTPCSNHGPEYEYLAEGEDVFVAAGDPGKFADLVVSRTGDDGRRSFEPRRYPTLDDMVGNFAGGILKMMSDAV